MSSLVSQPSLFVQFQSSENPFYKNGGWYLKNTQRCPLPSTDASTYTEPWSQTGFKKDFHEPVRQPSGPWFLQPSLMK